MRLIDQEGIASPTRRALKKQVESCWRTHQSLFASRHSLEEIQTPERKKCWTGTFVSSLFHSDMSKS